MAHGTSLGAWLCLLGFVSAWCSPLVGAAQADRALPSPLRLDHVVAIARRDRAEIAAARATARAAAQRPDMVSSLEDPVVFASLDHLPIMLDGADYSAGVEQRFPLSSVLGDRERAAMANARAERAAVARTALDVELDATSAFLMLHERRQIAAILGEQLVLAAQVAAASSARYASGTAPQPDLLRAEIEVARIEGAIRTIAAEVHAAEAMLNASLNRDVVAPVPTTASDAVTRDPPSAREVRLAALRRRPELRAARAMIQARNAEVEAMDAMYGPMAMVRVGGAYTMTDGPGAMLMVGLSIPIWRSRLGAGVAEAEAMVDMARSELAAMRRMIEAEALVSRERVLAARERFLVLRDEVVPRTSAVIDPMLASYASGQLPIVSVIEAVAALWSARSDLVMAERDLGLAWAVLDRATSGGAS